MSSPDMFFICKLNVSIAEGKKKDFKDHFFANIGQ